MSKNIRALYVFFGLLLAIVFASFCRDTVFAGGITTGDGGAYISGGGGGSDNVCSSYAYLDSCVHWVKVDRNQLRDAINSNYYQRLGYGLSPAESSAYNTCTSNEQNPSGYSVIAAHYNASTGILEFGNIWDGGGYNMDSKLHRRDGFFNEKIDSDSSLTYSDLLKEAMKQSGKSENDLSIFCSGMIVREEPSSGLFDSVTEAEVSEVDGDSAKVVARSRREGESLGQTASIYLQSSGNTNTTNYSIRHSIINNIKHVADVNWAVAQSPDNATWSWRNRGTIINMNAGPNSTRLVDAKSDTIRNMRLGTDQKYCQSVDHTNDASFVDYIVGGKITKTESRYGEMLAPSTNACIEVKHPYNFAIRLEQNVNGNNVVYAGEEFEATGKVTVAQNSNENQPGASHTTNSSGEFVRSSFPLTETSPTTELKMISFTLSPDKLSDGNERDAALRGGYTEQEPCAFFSGKIGNDIGCQDLTERSGAVADGSDDVSRNDVGNFYLTMEKENFVVPDVVAGTKFCTALAAYPAHSGNGYTLSSQWNITNANCYVVAKKPTFQVWNGGVYTSGNIDTSVSVKKMSDGAKHVFGSWSEQLVIAGRTISNFASGASLGYAFGYKFDLPGGGSSGKLEDNSPLTISNSQSDAIGNAGFSVSSNIVSLLKSRYADEKKQSSIDINGLWMGKDSGTKVYYSDDTVTIKNDICYVDTSVDGGCTVSDDSIRLIDQNLGGIDSASQIPQVLIFAKDIKIAPGVKRVDAWLIADNELDTCVDFETNPMSCNKTLMINGPVFANKLSLHRIAGADAGSGVHEEGADPRFQNLANDGSTTPAEIFNLRPDVYLWASAEAQKHADAVTVYTRELAPRL